MKPLTNLQTLLFLVGGLLMVVGSGAGLFRQPWAAYVFAPGSLLFAAMQMLQRYDGPSFVVRRLRRIQLLSDALFLLAALLLLANGRNFLPLSQLHYAQYVHNNWVVALLAAAILQLYTTHRIAAELEKEAKKR